MKYDICRSSWHKSRWHRTKLVILVAKLKFVDVFFLRTFFCHVSNWTVKLLWNLLWEIKEKCQRADCCSALWLSVQAGLFIIVNIATVIRLKNSFKPYGLSGKQYYLLVRKKKKIKNKCRVHATLYTLSWKKASGQCRRTKTLVRIKV